MGLIKRSPNTKVMKVINSDTNEQCMYTWAKCHLHLKKCFTAICQKIFCLPIIDSNNSQKKVS